EMFFRRFYHSFVRIRFADRTDNPVFLHNSTNTLQIVDVNVNINMYIFACLNMYNFNHFLY
ncbi:hypothetical protein ACE41A_22715, partial [Bacillus cytotoxicus]